MRKLWFRIADKSYQLNTINIDLNYFEKVTIFIITTISDDKNRQYTDLI